mmetsp:Transcript_31795/g.38434  ORF Transcript_31795/g.38434 Transcript_31795/m.38434 type:complete len:157 (-) Transcript_31795:273-743(-)|eukprot:CAMPEP_0197857826 /NCGR_PEP_ID=MMETSP1438-20131217/31229_1 /TAXON_ID=1461541 /ORGANISM="Pterosperma sp., Strain CCMP1384" /LENGTH=156 /DNA_ID=CAMNT_0043473801 /DNA_START=56 /DNA_END=526 /DNA_ORIENTATION=-
MAAIAQKSFAGVQVRSQQKVVRTTSVRPATVRCSAKPETSGRRQALSFVALTAAIAAMPKAAKADLTEDLLAKTAANKELNDKKRLATSGANLARSRTVTDGTCAFPNNLIGCENVAEKGGVKFLSDDLELECEGTDDKAICPAKAPSSFPSFFGV